MDTQKQKTYKIYYTATLEVELTSNEIEKDNFEAFEEIGDKGIDILNKGYDYDNPRTGRIAEFDSYVVIDTETGKEVCRY